MTVPEIRTSELLVGLGGGLVWVGGFGGCEVSFLFVFFGISSGLVALRCLNSFLFVFF